MWEGRNCLSCEDADVGGSWSAFGLCGSGRLGVGPCIVLCPSCCDGAGREGGLGALCVSNQCWQCDATSAPLAKWKRMSCAIFWRRWIDCEDASPFPTQFLCLFWCCACVGLESGVDELLSPCDSSLDGESERLLCPCDSSSLVGESEWLLSPCDSSLNGDSERLAEEEP